MTRSEFEGLESGVYSLDIEGGYEQTELAVDGKDGLEIQFMPLVETWDVKVSPAGSMPGYSVVRTEVEGMRGLPVYIWKEDWEGMMRRTGSKPEYGECSAEFSPLGPGHYMVEPEGLGVWADVELTGLEVVWIDFRRRSVPESPNIVNPLIFVEVPESEAPVEIADREVVSISPEGVDEALAGGQSTSETPIEEWRVKSGTVVAQRVEPEEYAAAEALPESAEDGDASRPDVAVWPGCQALFSATVCHRRYRGAAGAVALCCEGTTDHCRGYRRCGKRGRVC